MGLLAPVLLLTFALGALVLFAAVVRALLLPGRANLGLAHLLAPAEPSAARIAGMDWEQWLAMEDRLFHWLGQRLPGPGIAAPWRRSQRLLPEGPIRGAVVLLHGLSDGPWSLNHFAFAAQRAGLAVVAPRLPGHGTAPAALLRVRPAQWHAVAALALREARRLAGDGPVSIFGYSNGAALALMAALKPDAAIHRLVLISPMIGVRKAAIIARLMALPARLRLIRAADWLRLNPETNPYKYQSFPLISARHSRNVSRQVQRALRAPGAIARLPPMLIAQSLADRTVEVADLERVLLRRLTEMRRPPHRLLLFGASDHAPLPLQKRGADMVARAPAALDVTLVSGAADGNAILRHRPAGEAEPPARILAGGWPRALLSLSHVALPFPVDDAVFGIPLATLDMVPHGEPGVLGRHAPAIARVTCNPCFPLLLTAAMKGLTATAGDAA